MTTISRKHLDLVFPLLLHLLILVPAVTSPVGLLNDKFDVGHRLLLAELILLLFSAQQLGMYVDFAGVIVQSVAAYNGKGLLRIRLRHLSYLFITG